MGIKPEQIMWLKEMLPGTFEHTEIAQLLKHRYVRELLKLYDAGKFPSIPGELVHVNCIHDDWCPIYRGHLCSCNVEVEIISNRDLNR